MTSDRASAARLAQSRHSRSAWWPWRCWLPPDGLAMDKGLGRRPAGETGRHPLAAAPVAASQVLRTANSGIELTAWPRFWVLRPVMGGFPHVTHIRAPRGKQRGASGSSAPPPSPATCRGGACRPGDSSGSGAAARAGHEIVPRRRTAGNRGLGVRCREFLDLPGGADDVSMLLAESRLLVREEHPQLL